MIFGLYYNYGLKLIIGLKLIQKKTPVLNWCLFVYLRENYFFFPAVFSALAAS